jgi:hypothetical protein
MVFWMFKLCFVNYLTLALNRRFVKLHLQNGNKN